MPGPDAARFQPGQRVRIVASPSVGHCRTPRYLRGAPASVVSLIGRFRNPEELAYGGKAPLAPLYWVEVRLADLWPDAPATDDSLRVEIYEHWLREDADAP